MPKQVRLPDGTIGQFPDTMGDDEIQTVLQKQFPSAGSTPPAAPTPTFLQGVQNSFDTNTATSPTEPLLQTGLKRVVGALGAPLIHPLDTLKGVINTVPTGFSPTPIGITGEPSPLAARIGEGAQDVQTGGVPYAATKLAGDALGTYLGGKIGEAGVNAAANVPAIARGGADILAGTGPKTAANLVADTSEANKGAIADAADANATATAKRAQQLQEHFTRTQAANDANTASQAAQSRKVALQRGVETLDPLHKADLQNLEGTVRAEANRRYNTLNATLENEPTLPYQELDESGKPLGEPEPLLPKLLTDASEAMKGSNTETPIMKDLESRLKHGEPLNYRDLQGYRSEIGQQLQRGSLPGDVFHAYKGMMGTITDAMRQIAEGKDAEINSANPPVKSDLAGDLDAARDYYRKMSDTFDDSRSPIRRALNSTEPGGVVKAFTGKDKSGIEALAQYDPDLAQRINTTRGYAAEAKGIRSSTAAPKVAPILKPGPTPVQPDITQLGPEDIQSAKADALATRANKIRNTGHGLANTMAVLDGIRNIMHGNVGGLVTDVGARGGLSLAQHGLAAALEHPAIANWLTQPTAADLAELAKLSPAERTVAAQNIQPLIDAASQRGLRVAPAISTLFATGATLPAGHPLAASQPAQ